LQKCNHGSPGNCSADLKGSAEHNLGTTDLGLLDPYYCELFVLSSFCFSQQNRQTTRQSMPMDSHWHSTSVSEWNVK